MSWPFPEPPDTAAFTSANVLEKHAPVVFVSHASDDGSWQFHSAEGASADLSLARVVALRTILARDRTLATIADLPRGWWARRARVNAPWERFEAAVEPPKSTRPLVHLTRTCKGCGERYPAQDEVCPHCGNVWEGLAVRIAPPVTTGLFAPEHAAVSWGVPGGLLLIVVAVVWFFLGLANGRIFYYPPVLLLIGLFGVANGLWGEKPRKRRAAQRAKASPREGAGR
jgi:hypothetical protein